MTRHAVVTGAEGFVGTVLIDHLKQQGWTVTGSTAKADPARPDLRPCDVRDEAQVAALFEAEPACTHVFHLAAVSHVPAAIRDPVATFRVNLEGTFHIAAALKTHCSKARLVYISSSEIYGKPRALPMTEDHPVAPANPYAISKAAADAYCAFLAASEGFDVVRVRPFNHTGPGQPDDFVLPNFAHQLVRMEQETAPNTLRVGNLDAARDFLHVNDVVDAYERIALEGKSGEAYNVCSGHSWTIREALNRMIELTRADVHVELDPDRLRPADVPEMRGCHAKVTADTGWEPQTPFAALLADLLAYWRTREAAIQ